MLSVLIDSAVTGVTSPSCYALTSAYTNSGCCGLTSAEKKTRVMNRTQGLALLSTPHSDDVGTLNNNGQIPQNLLYPVSEATDTFMGLQILPVVRWRAVTKGTLAHGYGSEMSADWNTFHTNFFNADSPGERGLNHVMHTGWDSGGLSTGIPGNLPYGLFKCLLTLGGTAANKIGTFDAGVDAMLQPTCLFNVLQHFPRCPAGPTINANTGKCADKITKNPTWDGNEPVMYDVDPLPCDTSYQHDFQERAGPLQASCNLYQLYGEKIMAKNANKPAPYGENLDPVQLLANVLDFFASESSRSKPNNVWYYEWAEFGIQFGFNPSMRQSYYSSGIGAGYTALPKNNPYTVSALPVSQEMASPFFYTCDLVDPLGMNVELKATKAAYCALTSAPTSAPTGM